MTDPLAEKLGINVQGGTVNVQNLNLGIADRLEQSGKRVKILVVAANPLGSSPLKLDHEVKTIKEALKRSRNRDNFDVDYQLAATPSELRRALLDFEPHILHFSGHGAGEKGLLFVSDESAGAISRSDSGEVRSRSTNTNEIKFVPAQPLANLLQLCDEHLECVVLNACYSDVQGDAISANIPFTIGMRDLVDDHVAIKFSQGFYDAIGAGKSYEKAFEWGKVAIEFDLADDEAAKILVLRKKGIKMTSQQSQDNPSIKQSALENVTAGGNINVTIHQSASAQPTKQNSSDNIRQQFQQRQIDTLKAEIEAISNQWESAFSDEQRLQLKKRLNQKLKQLEGLEHE
jgi:CHAT domain